MLVRSYDNAYDLMKEFIEYDKDRYSLAGYDFIIDCFDGDPVELDVIGIACQFTEYGSYCDIDFTGLLSDYFGIEKGSDGLAHCVVDGEEYYTDDLNDWAYGGELVDAACEYLESMGIGYRLSNHDFMVVE